MSRADEVYRDLLKRVLTDGVSNEGQEVRPKWPDNIPAYTRSVFFATATYDLSEEFPIHTLRPTAFKSCIEEILWIWQQKSNNIKDLKPKIWDAWADESGSIGKAYGYQLRQKHIFPEGVLDQVDHVLYSLKYNPADRGILTNIYNHADLHEMRLRPCVYACTFDVDDGKLNVQVDQRSADLIVAGGWNLTQYAVLAYMLAQVSGLKPGILAYAIANAHIYDRHIEIAEDLIMRKSYPAPKFIMNTNVTNFYDFRSSDFALQNYQTGEQVRDIPVAV